MTQSLIDYVLYRYGCPQTIISDNGYQLKSQQLAKTLATFEIKYRTTPVHAPHCNPVERTNRVVKTMVAIRRPKSPEMRLTLASITIRLQCGGPGIHRILTRIPKLRTRIEHWPKQPECGRTGYQTATIGGGFRSRKNQAGEDIPAPGKTLQPNLRRRDWRPTIGDKVWKKEYPFSNKAKPFNAKLAPKYIRPMEIRRII